MSRRAVAAGGGRAARTGEDVLLDAFAARAAHALGAGLSITGGYATLLRERFADPLGRRRRRRARRARRAASTGMRLFVDDLLELTGLDAVAAAARAAGGRRRRPRRRRRRWPGR